MKCKNCDYKKKHKPLTLVFSSGGYGHYNPTQGNVEKKCPYCGCVNPEPKTQKDCCLSDAHAPRVEEAKKE